MEFSFSPESVGGEKATTKILAEGVRSIDDAIGEIGITGMPAAIANAVYNATGKRVRDWDGLRPSST